LSRKRRALAHKHQSKQNNFQQSTYDRNNDQNIVEFDKYRQKKTKITLIPKSLKQETYIDMLEETNNKIVFATGPAGTGKTMLAVITALKLLREGEFRKIVVTRPAVGVDDEQHGFLPGDLNEKMAPWTRPIFDYIQEYYTPLQISKMLEDSVLEISPLAFMRGRTFKNSYIIADEMQNATPGQMKMLLTRLGEGSKIVVTGDTRQADRSDSENGLLDFKRLVDAYGELKYVSGIQFEGNDIQRDPAVTEILKLYNDL
jgi:phosphate starvation-inducible PhoH-like protein